MPDDSYYRLQQHDFVSEGGQVKGALTILRKDTEETVGRITKRGQDTEDVALQLRQAAGERLLGLGRPENWGKDPIVARLVNRYLKNRDRLYGFEQRAEAAGSAEEAARIRAEGRETEGQLDPDIAAALVALTPDQRLELASVTDAQAARLDEPRMLDVLTAKRDLAGRLFSPSPQEIAALQQLQRWLDSDA